jgi:hypothetical protein
VDKIFFIIGRRFEMVNEKKKLSTNEQLILQNKIANRDQWVKEIGEQDKQLKNIKRIMDIFDAQRKLQAKNSEIMFSKFVLLKPSWEFETDAEYMSNHMKLQQLAAEVKEMEFDGVVASRNADYERILKQRNDLQAELDALDKKIVEMKGE